METRTRYRCRTDLNHQAIANYLRKAGCLVFSLHTVGRGFPDLLVLIPGGRLALVEVKSPKGRLTPDQERFISDGWPVVVVRDEGDCDRLLRSDLTPGTITGEA